MLHIYTGDGKGKTTCAIGLAARASGSGMRCCVFQFLKNGDSSEINTLKNSVDFFCQDEKLGFIFQMDDLEIQHAKAVTQRLWQKAENICEDYDFVVFDELFIALQYKFIDLACCVALLEKYPQKEFVLTGRGAPDVFLDMADYVTRMQMIKHPFEKGVQARRGIEY